MKKATIRPGHNLETEAEEGSIPSWIPEEVRKMIPREVRKMVPGDPTDTRRSKKDRK